MNFPFDPSWTLFLDRDGVINQRIFGGYVRIPEEFHFENGAIEAIALLKNHFKRIIVVTNQQCIAKKVLTERNLQDLHRYMQGKLLEQNADVDAIYFAPELASDPNNTRKPKPDMAMAAQKDFPEIDFKKCLMVGDTDTDIQFGENLGMKTVLIRSKEKTNKEADWQFDSLLEFAQQVEKNG